MLPSKNGNDKKSPLLTIKGTKVGEQFETAFVSHRDKLKQFYKNKKYKVISHDQSLIENSTRDLIERSITATHHH